VKFRKVALAQCWRPLADIPIPGVLRLVIPAKAGIQPGFLLALRLAGMTRVLPTLSLDPAARFQDTL
jgi:hypothetical protein